MALTKDELLEMINSTISSNGTKAITGDALNAALTALVETLSATYEFPNMWDTMLTDEEYIFSAEEATAFRKAWDNRDAIRFVAKLKGAFNGSYDIFCELARMTFNEDGYDVYLFCPAATQNFLDNAIYDFCVEDNGDELKAYFW